MEIREELENIYKNYNLIIGVDEVGRGCLAGPVVSCAIIMKKDSKIDGVTDSKKLSKKKRVALYDKILEECVGYGIGIVDNVKIDEINIKQASRLAMKIPQLNLIHGDELSYVVSCASIIAKEYRDNMFVEYEEKYPNYNFIKNVGYGTKDHYKGIFFAL